MWKGMDFPFRKTIEGYCELVDYGDKVRASVKQILFTRKGERVMVPEFGSGIMGLVHEPLSEEMIAKAIMETYESLRKWEPRLAVTNVDAVVQGDTRILFDITYEIAGIEDKLNVEVVI